MNYFENLKPTSVVHHQPAVVSEEPDVSREELIVLLVHAGAVHPEWRFGELVANVIRPGTSAPALRNVSDRQLARLLRNSIDGKPEKGLALS